MVKKTTIFAMLLRLISVSLFGCKSTQLDSTSAFTISNGIETITPFMLLIYASIVDESGKWLAADGAGNFQFEISDYVEEMPSIQATDKKSVLTNINNKFSEVMFYNADFDQIVNVSLEKITELDPGTYYLRQTADTSGRTVGGQTEHTLDYGFVKIMVAAAR